MAIGVAAVLGLVAIGVIQGPNSYVEVQDLDGGLVARTTLPAPATRLAWAPDGSALAVALEGGVYVLDGHSLRPRRVVDAVPQEIGSLAVSAGGRQVAFTGEDCAWDASTVVVYLVEVASGRRRAVHLSPRTDYDRQVQTAVRVVQWSPDGRRVLVSRKRFPGSSCDPHTRRTQADALVVERTDGRRWVVAHDARSPRWRPDGTRLAYLTQRGRRLMVADADGRHPHRLAPRRDVRRLAWIGRRGALAVSGHSGIAVVDANGRGHRRRRDQASSLLGSATIEAFAVPRPPPVFEVFPPAGGWQTHLVQTRLPLASSPGPLAVLLR